MRYVSVMVSHFPDAGRETRNHFSYTTALACSDLDTAREFAFQALGEGSYQKGHVQVVSPMSRPTNSALNGRASWATT